MTDPPKSKSSSAEDLERATVAPSGAKGGRCGACFRRLLTFLFSTVGLTCLTVGYSALGGYIFMVLESTPMPAPAEIWIQPEEAETVTVFQLDEAEPVVYRSGNGHASLDRHLDLLWNLTENLNVLQRDEWIRMAKEVLVRYTDDLYASIEGNGTMHLKTPEPEPADNQWTYPGALLYAITVITTIGYGHITPKTPVGMIVTMIYAIIGLPLTFLTVAHLGRIMATTVRFLYHNICCCFLCRRGRHSNGRSCCCSCCRRSDTKRPSAQATDPIMTREATPCVDGNNCKPEVDGTAAAASVEEPTPLPKRKIKLAEVQVPISVTVLILVGYIGIGTLLFSLWEGWGPIESSYFCFITLSTIGFGDFVPGKSIGESDSQEKLLCCAVYLLLGLSCLAMCFDLIQQEVVHKCRRLGACIGLVQPDNKQ